ATSSTQTGLSSGRPTLPPFPIMPTRPGNQRRRQGSPHGYGLGDHPNYFSAAKAGRAPWSTKAFAVETKVNDGWRISSGSMQARQRRSPVGVQQTHRK